MKKKPCLLPHLPLRPWQQLLLRTLNGHFLLPLLSCLLSLPRRWRDRVGAEGARPPTRARAAQGHPKHAHLHPAGGRRAAQGGGRRCEDY